MRKGSRYPHSDELVRFFSKMDVDPSPDGCWLWRAVLNADGYGHFLVGGRYGKQPAAHRYAYTFLNGPVPAGLEIDHLCRVRHCVNPFHLEAVTHAVNVRRGQHRNMIAHHTKCCIMGHHRDDYAVRKYCLQCRHERYAANKDAFNAIRRVKERLKRRHKLAVRMGVLPQTVAV